MSKSSLLTLDNNNNLHRRRANSSQCSGDVLRAPRLSWQDLWGWGLSADRGVCSSQGNIQKQRSRSLSWETFLMIGFILQALLCISYFSWLKLQLQSLCVFMCSLKFCLFHFLSFMIHSQSQNHSENSVLDMRHLHFSRITHNIYFQPRELLKAKQPLPLSLCLPSKAECVWAPRTWFEARWLCIEYVISSEDAKETADYFYIFNLSR